MTPQEREQLERVETFARLARENLDLTDEVLGSIGEPIRVRAVPLDGSTTPLSSFAIAVAVAVSLMFITLLLAAGALALEREENAFLRLVRGLVSRTGLLFEKVGLAAVCSLVVCLLMLAGLGLFVTLEWDRFHLWVVAIGAGALAFAALGLADRRADEGRPRVVAAVRDVVAAARVPRAGARPGAVSPALYDVIRVISAAFPFKPALDALDAAINDAGGLGGALLHLAALFAVFATLTRVALRRFA